MLILLAQKAKSPTSYWGALPPSWGCVNIIDLRPVHAAAWTHECLGFVVQLLRHLTLCDPVDCSLPWDFQARILECIAISFSSGSFWPRVQTQVSCLAGGFFTAEPPGKPGCPRTTSQFLWFYSFCRWRNPWEGGQALSPPACTWGEGRQLMTSWAKGSIYLWQWA